MNRQWLLRGLRLVTRLVYRIRIEGSQNVPARGGALLVCNHLSLVDALLVMASTGRWVRFLAAQSTCERPLFRPFARMLRVIPMSSEQRPRELTRSLEEASQAIHGGEIVCIFAEGQISRIGQMLPFHQGFERIMKTIEAPIIPVCLDGVWGSIFSYASGRFFWKLPRRIPYPVTVSFGVPMRSTVSPLEVRTAIQELNTQVWPLRKARMHTINRTLVHTARRHPFRFAMADTRVAGLSFGAALTRTLFLAIRLRGHWAGSEKVGILLPPSVAGALVNYAALLLGKVPVNLNYTLSQDTLESCARQCGLKNVVTSQTFLDRINLKLPCPAILLETVAAKPSLLERVQAFIMAWFCPAFLLEKALGGRRVAIDDLATVIFSSGSTGDPKGVMLTHYNIASNVAQLGQAFDLAPQDRLLGILPFFHSFGFTGTLVLPGMLGAGVVFHANPLEPKPVGDLVRQHQLTFLIATPTFLQVYLRSCEPEDFGSLKFVLTGAEKLSERLAEAFEEKFGLRPMEAYGCTECSPGVAVNSHDYRAAGLRQVGGRRGKIGRPLPGVSVRIVDPDTRSALDPGQPGLLLVKGPNVMTGYLNRPDKTAEAFWDGWYVTGDVATLDEDGFLQITDRLSRFSKIGGEMVPHVKVEEQLHELAGVTEFTFAVTGVPDEKKGERLVVLHRLPEDELRVLLRKLPKLDLPNLWIPRAQQFFRVETFPQLGSGKLDLRKIRDLASHLSTQDGLAGMNPKDVFC